MIERTTSHATPPRLRVELIGTDGNAFAVLGRVLRALREAGWSQEEIGAFKAEATLRTVMKSVDVV